MYSSSVSDVLTYQEGVTYVNGTTGQPFHKVHTPVQVKKHKPGISVYEYVYYIIRCSTLYAGMCIAELNKVRV